MALGKWITNTTKKCSLLCPNSPHYYPPSTGTSYGYTCPWCDPNYWNDKEEGPMRPDSFGRTYPDIIGVYEKQPGPKGQFAAGFSLPPAIGASNPFWNATGTYTGRFSPSTTASSAGSAIAGILNAPANVGVTSTKLPPSAVAEKLKQIRKEEAEEEKPCPCSVRDLLTWGHKCGRKAPIDRR